MSKKAEQKAIKIYELTPISQPPEKHGRYFCMWQRADAVYPVWYDLDGWGFDEDMKTPDGWLKPSQSLKAKQQGWNELMTVYEEIYFKLNRDDLSEDVVEHKFLEKIQAAILKIDLEAANKEIAEFIKFDNDYQ